jgi:hypothetical protein
MTTRNFIKTVLFGSFLALGACGDDDGGDAPGIDAGMSGMPPVISQVAWTTPAGCTAGTASVFTVVTTVTDADTAAAMLTFSGTVAGCTGTINAASADINCPNAAPYGGNVTVTDPEGNSDTQAISIGVCTDGMAP